jgi:hypothetical protein
MLDKKSRHNWLRILATVLSLNMTAAFAGTTVTLYKSPACECCDKYVRYLQDNGFKVQALNQDGMSGIKKRYGVSHLASCHTSIINGYVVEGHVPVGAIRKLLKEKPAITGISAPGMPKNSPGMGETKPGALAIYAVTRPGNALKVFSVE